MGNAAFCVKEIADMTAASNEEDGVAQILEKLVQKNKAPTVPLQLFPRQRSLASHKASLPKTYCKSAGAVFSTTLTILCRFVYFGFIINLFRTVLCGSFFPHTERSRSWHPHTVPVPPAYLHP